MKKIIWILSAAILTINLCKTQAENDSLRMSFGIFANYALNFHSADFGKVPGCPSCNPGYESGSGSGYALGALFEYPMSDMFTIGARIAYFDLSAKLTKTENTTVIVEGSPVEGAFEHSLEATLTDFGFEPMVKVNIFKDLYVNLGLHAGFLTTKNYSQLEQIVKPDGVGTLIDSNGVDTKKRTRNEFSGELQSAASMLFMPFAGVSYTLPLNNSRTLILEPEAYFFLGVNNIVDDPLVNKWIPNSFRVGAALKYSPERGIPIIDKFEKIEKIDTIKIEDDFITQSAVIQGKFISKTETKMFDKVRLTQETVTRTDTLLIPKIFELKADITAVGVDDKGNETPMPLLVVEEFISSRLQPLLNYIFFDEGSSKLGNRYKKLEKSQVSKFNENQLFKATILQSYYHVLNVFGSRLKNNPKTELTIIGCNDGFSSEKNNLELSKARAETIKKYFEDVWGISQKRLNIETRNLPEKASTPISEPDKIIENRRVELYSKDYEISKPIFANDTLRKTNPPVLRFKPTATVQAGTSEWSVSARQAGTLLKIFDMNTPKVENLDWLVESDQSAVPIKELPLEYSIVVKDKRGKTVESSKKVISIDQITLQKKRKTQKSDKEIDSYSLILFDFDKADIAGMNRKIIDFIKDRIKPEATVTIKGYTDRTGEENYNRNLSQKRADGAMKLIGSKNATSQGIGEDELIYDNNLPEGRFYCRTVDIIVETPIK
ncbi:MAG: OmpA-like protein [Bacteroidota bacterium]|nr:OmpA-like protein [Bacteroidota bacterium]